jgi:hypothetical protein
MPIKLPTKTDGTQLTADELLQKDFVNVLKKMQAGKPLTKGERELIIAAGYTDTTDGRKELPKRANDKNMRIIIESEFGVSERKAYTWLTKLRDRYWSKSGLWRVADAVAEIEKRRDAATAGPDRDLKREKLLLECDILRDRRDRDRGDHIPLDQFRSELNAIAQAFRWSVDIWVKTTAAEIGNPDVKRKLEDARRKAYKAILAAVPEA